MILKKATFLLLSFFIMIAGLTAQNPIGYWQLDELSGNLLTDASGNGQNATLNNTDDATFVSGKLNGAVLFDGGRDATAPNAEILKPKSLTVAAYVKADPSLNDWEWIAAHGDNWGLYITANGVAELYYYDGGEWPNIAGSINVRDSQWHHIAATFDDETKEMNLYIDGELEASVISTGSITYEFGNDFHIGSMNSDRKFLGVIDELRVYDKVLTETQIKNLLVGSTKRYILDLSIVGSGIVSVVPKADSYLEGTEVTLSAMPVAEDGFLGWSGDTTTTINPLVIVINSDQSIAANFTEVEPSVYYVSTTGNDGNNGSNESPWATITHASNNVFPGDTIIVKPGIYDEVVSISSSGLQGKFITIRGEEPVSFDTDEGAVFDGNLSGYDQIEHGLFTLTNVNYIILDGFKIRNVKTNGIRVRGFSTNIAIQNCITEHTRGCGIYVYGNDNFSGTYHIRYIKILHNEVHWPQEGVWDGHLYWQEDITLGGGTELFEIAYNYVNAYDSVNYSGGPIGIDTKDGVRFGSVHHNVVENIPSNGIYLDAWASKAEHIDIYNNYVHNVTSIGIQVGAERGGPIDSVRVFNNIIWNAGYVGIASGNYTGGTHPPPQPKTHLEFFNNTIYRVGYIGFNDQGNGIGTQSSVKQSKIYNNIVMDCLPNGMDVYTGDGNIITNNCIYKTLPDQDYGDYGDNPILHKDPLFENANAGNFVLKGTSPCIDAGIFEGVPSFDYNDTPRPIGNKYDVGAFEVESTAGVIHKKSSSDLLKIYPNPFTSSANINYAVPESSKVRLSIYDVTGKEVKLLVNKNQQPGNYQIKWNGDDDKGNHLSGVYFIKLNTGNISSTNEVVIY